jgi:hypothetical protein
MDDYVLTLFVLGQGQMNMTPKAFSFEDYYGGDGGIVMMMVTLKCGDDDNDGGTCKV